MNNHEYTGKDNLEVMSEAFKYNHFLLGMILALAKNDQLIVDFGAGSGTFARSVTMAGHRLLCVEVDNSLAYNLKCQGLTVVRSLDEIEDRSVDFIYSLNVLEHIKDDTAVLHLWNKKLRFGGDVFIYVPAFQFLYSSMDRKVGHFRRYTRSDLCAKVSNAGFRIVEANYVDSLGVLATLAYKAMKRDNGGINSKTLHFYDSYIFPLSRTLDAITCGVIGKNVYVQAKNL